MCFKEQHIAEEREGKIGAMNEMTENEQDPGMQQSRQYYPNLSPSLQMTPESKYYNQRRYMSHVPNIGLAWSVSNFSLHAETREIFFQIPQSLFRNSSFLNSYTERSSQF